MFKLFVLLKHEEEEKCNPMMKVHHCYVIEFRNPLPNASQDVYVLYTSFVSTGVSCCTKTFPCYYVRVETPEDSFEEQPAKIGLYFQGRYIRFHQGDLG